MWPRLIPTVIIIALTGFVGASAGTALSPEFPRMWSAAVALVILGGITPLIYAVNARIIPVFSRRDWQTPNLLAAAMFLAIASGWLAFVGRSGGWNSIEATAMLLALAGGLAFMISVVRLFRSPATNRPASPLPFPEQKPIDQIGIRFTRLAGIWLIVGLLTGAVLVFWTPGAGRWELVWAHAMLIGWFLSMASGVCYHVLPRWTGQKWRWPRLPLAHLRLVQLGLPVMVLALATDWGWLFFIAGPVQSVALLLFVANVLPQARHLPVASRIGVTAAGWMLVIGVTLGAGFAVDPANHASLRFTHAQTNLFGWTALLVCGVGYYLFPRFANQVLAWPVLARLQMGLLAAMVVVNGTVWWWYVSREPGYQWLVIGSGLLITVSMLAFVGIIARTMLAATPRAAISNVEFQARRASSRTLKLR